MRITYRTLKSLIGLMSDDQLDSDVMVEVSDAFASECYSAELRLAGDNHDGGLDDGDPVFFVDAQHDDDDRRCDVEYIAKIIGLIPTPS